MKLQHSAVIFVIIFIPIILVTSYFISLQVNTIKLEASYSEKLLNATYDAMTAFELNTANEDLSSVSDSLRSIIDASNNIFFNTLCTNLGVSNASKSYVQPYIPAILYTLYDGYYIYSPTNIPEICVDKFGRTIRTSDYGVRFVEKKNNIGIYEFNNDAIKYNENSTTEPEGLLDANYEVKYAQLEGDIKEEYGQILYKNNDGSYSTQLHTWSGDPNHSTYYKRDYILKSYIPYSATYSNGSDIDITINYTLDNFMTIEGMINGIYYTKSGYFIDNSLVSSIIVDDTSITDWTQYSEEKLDDYIYNPNEHEVIVKLNDGVIISNKDGQVQVSNESGSGFVTKYWDDAQSAVKYYVDSYIFSYWVHYYLGDIEAQNLKNAQYSVTNIQEQIVNDNDKIGDTQTNLLKDMLYKFDDDTSKPFSKDNNDPESGESSFYKHKRNVIKNSITYNLILSMLVYTEESKTVEYNMPVFQENEWDRILNNVSITAFMEGLRCGLKYYNNYAIVTSTNNEISVTENEIYYVPRVIQDTTMTKEGTELNVKILSNTEDGENSNPKGIYETAHRIDCEELELGGEPWLGCISFKSKEIKYDKILDNDGKYKYDHKVYTDYDCIVDSNYKVKNINNTYEDGNTDILKYLLKNATSEGSVPDEALRNQLKYKLVAYRIAIAKERNNLYKTTAFPENYGWQVGYLNTEKKCNGTLSINPGEFESFVNDKKISEIKKIEVTIEGAQQNSTGVYTSNVKVKYNGDDSLGYDEQTISTTSTSRRTLEFIKDFNNSSTISSIVISADDTEFIVKAIKFYYK